jgi:thiol peroxidase
MALQTAPERAGAATFKGNPITLLGNEVKVGEKAPQFEVQKNLLETVSLDSYAGKIKLISVVPSLDTGVCDTQTRRFNQEASSLSENVVVLTVSVDLPFAQSRWCGAAGVDRVITLSDYKNRNFGEAFGVYIKEFGLLMRSVFVIDADDNVSYVEYLGEMTAEPNYAAAIDAVKAIIG